MYSYFDLNDCLHQIMKTNDHKTTVNDIDKYDNNIVFVLTTYKIIEVTNNYQLDLRNTNFGGVIGFDKKIVQATDTHCILIQTLLMIVWWGAI